MSKFENKVVDMSDWIWDSDKDHCRLSTYEFYQFMSFTDIDGNDFININGNNLGEFLAITIIQENINTIVSSFYDPDKPSYRYRIICVGYEKLVTLTKLISRKYCQIVKDTDRTMVYYVPTATIAEAFVTDIINYLKCHHIDYKMTPKQKELLDKYEGVQNK